MTATSTSTPTPADELRAAVESQTDAVERAARNLVHKERTYNATHKEEDWRGYLAADEGLRAHTDRLVVRIGNLRVATGAALEDDFTEREVIKAVAESTRELFLLQARREIEAVA